MKSSIRFCFARTACFVLVAIVFFCCSAPSNRNFDCVGFSDGQLDWLRKRGYSKRVEALPCDKQVEIAKIIQTELEFSDELDSLVVDMNALQKHLPDSLKVVVTR